MNGVMIAMEDKYMEELKRKLEQGEISQALFDEIKRRWTDKSTGKAEDEDKDEKKPSEKKGTTSISGSGHFSNVTAEYLRISGSGQVSGEVDVDSMTVSGSGKVGGRIKVSNILETSGSLRAQAEIEADSIESSGSLHAGRIKANMVDSSGSLKVEQAIEAKKLDVSGSCVAGNIISEEFDCSGMLKTEDVKGGSVRISGVIKAESVDCRNFEMSMEGGPLRSQIGKLHADTVKISSRKRFFRSSIEIGEIKCKTGSFEYVKAERVIADEVVVGNGSEIDYVEAKVIKTSGDAVIKEKKIV